MCLSIIILPNIGFGQDTTRARKNLNYLAGKKLMGRGYLLKGDQKAADFIRNEFIESGLKPLSGSYLQPFSISQNQFPKTPLLKINGRNVEAGGEFIPLPACPSVSGCFRLVQLDSTALQTKLNVKNGVREDEAWAIPGRLKKWLFNQPSFATQRPQVLVWLESKLTHSLAEESEKMPAIALKNKILQPADSILELKITSKIYPNIKTQNVIGLLKGTLYPDSFLILCAHYDHLGSLGKQLYFPGANDNASGTSMLLEMASYFSKHPSKYSVLLIAFSGEEAGLLGSQYFVKHSPIPLSNIKFVFNMDLMGFGENGATVVNATLHPEQFKRLTEINTTHHYLPELKSRGKAANSDHYYFSEAGVPAFFIYTLGGLGYYHDVNDRPETVTFIKFTETFNLITHFIEGF